MQGFSVLNIFLLVLGRGLAGFVNTVAWRGSFLAIPPVFGSVQGSYAALIGME